MTIGVKYVSYFGNSGYGAAALAYVRALHNAGVAVWWPPIRLGPESAAGSATSASAKNHGSDPSRRPDWRIPAGTSDPNLRDVAPLLRHVSREIPYDTVIAHTVPEHWAAIAEAGKQNVGYTAWETDTLPAHWPPLLDRCDKVLVPSTMNADVFTRGDRSDRGTGKSPTVHVIPHIRRYIWHTPTPEEKAELRRKLMIPDDHFVFYCINVWDPRKALPDLITIFLQQFNARDKVTLVLKTTPGVSNAAADASSGLAVSEIVGRIIAKHETAIGVRGPHIALIASEDVSTTTIDTLHAIGDCFVSLTHGEGWGLGAFDAATLGKPVIITGWGGQLDYLGTDYAGLIGFRMVPVAGWRPTASYQATQHWAAPDLDQASRLMRRMVSHYGDFLDHAAIARENVLNRYSEAMVARTMIAAIDERNPSDHLPR